MYARVTDAHAIALDYPRLGDFIARLVVPTTDESIGYRKTGSIENSHHTLWGSAERILAAVHSVLPV